jgi:iron complex outermembrane recepter protein
VINIRFRDAQPAVETLTGGNPDLEPEISHTLTMGVAWSDIDAGLQVSLDYFDIDVTGAIAALTSQQIADFCTAGQAEFCARIQPSANPIAALTLRSPFLNFNEVQRAGYDFALSWRVPLDIPGTLNVGLNGTYMSHDRENAGNGFIERAGQSTIAPRVVASGAVGYSLGKVFALAQIRHISSGRFDNAYVEGVNINDNSVAGATYLNLSGACGITRDLQIFGVVNNALDRDPPIAPASFNLPTTAIYFDTVGRSYRLGMRYRF